MNQRNPDDKQNIGAEIDQKIDILDSMSASTKTTPVVQETNLAQTVHTAEVETASDTKLSFEDRTGAVEETTDTTKVPSDSDRVEAKVSGDHEVDENEPEPGGYTNLSDLLERFDFLYNDYFKGAMDDDRRVFDDYVPKSFIIEKSMAAQIDALAKKMKKRKGFHKRLVNTGLKIALDLYKLQLEQQEQTQPKRR
ncbi:hypothetical protein [Alicyclobacillus sp. ALC3]|uniref:hypothetical protein n=1 Tax=Alicyclobacillus sp. ALC3 TaxID=2796143 RepID=UPI0023789298|nr:hypothetical protein [Alicyclobacillus sp. ALC3]WDL99797.1 hypothetical protein JC200_23795 [Alicyclobacillus sp. ALC3]